jgi:fumarate reductase flavoprotein subunit
MAWDYDVIVVGGGGAGLSAAFQAHARGASCMILEADKMLGGATRYSTGVFYAAGTSVQKARGIMDDTANAMFDYIMTLEQWDVRPDITRVLCDRSAESLEWLIQLGATFPPEWLVCSGVDTVPRGHPCGGTGDEIARVLINAVGANGVDTAVATRVEDLILEDGRIAGVRASGTELRAPSVIVATGGFGNSPEMLKRWFPSAAYHGERTWAVHRRANFIVGDGITLGQNAGAAIVGYDQGLLLPTTGFGQFEEAFIPPWVMLVNKEGRRFMAEYCAYSVSGYLINAQTDRRAFAIFDEPTLKEAGNDLRFGDPYSSGTPTPTWEDAMIREQVKKGKVQAANSLPELAAIYGIDPVGLQATIEEYNENCRAGHDPVYLKESAKFFPVETPPFFGIDVRAAIIGQTSCGLDIDRFARVRDPHNRVIPGLYAGGEVLGCVHGPRYAGGGMGINSAITLGRLAGEMAADYAMAARGGNA